MDIPFLLTKIEKVDRGLVTKMNDKTKEEAIKRIDEQIEQKKLILFNKHQFLTQTVKENEYLKLVQSDYQKYRDFILKNKQMQIDSMKLIQKYLDKLIVEGGLTDEDIEKAKKDQDNVLTELNGIRDELNKLIE